MFLPAGNFGPDDAVEALHLPASNHQSFRSNRDKSSLPRTILYCYWLIPVHNTTPISQRCSCLRTHAHTCQCLYNCTYMTDCQTRNQAFLLADERHKHHYARDLHDPSLAPITPKA